MTDDWGSDDGRKPGWSPGSPGQVSVFSPVGQLFSQSEFVNWQSSTPPRRAWATVRITTVSPVGFLLPRFWQWQSMSPNIAPFRRSPIPPFTIAAPIGARMPLYVFGNWEANLYRPRPHRTPNPPVSIVSPIGTLIPLPSANFVAWESRETRPAIRRGDWYRRPQSETFAPVGARIPPPSASFVNWESVALRPARRKEDYTRTAHGKSSVVLPPGTFIPPSVLDDTTSFEDPGPFPGDALGWSWDPSHDHWMVSRYLLLSFEEFELGWGGDPIVLAFDDLNSFLAVYGQAFQTFYDDFEREWHRADPSAPSGHFPSTYGTSNDSFSPILDGTIGAEYPPASGQAFDGFENQWSNDNFLDFFFGVQEIFDDFESGWNATAPFVTTEADYQPNLDPFENFESVKFDQPISVTVPNTFTVPSHGFNNGDKVKFFTAIDGTGGQLPSGINDRIEYFIVNKTTHTFEVSQLSGGPAQDMSDVGSGANYVRANPAVSWGGRDGDTSGSDP